MRTRDKRKCFQMAANSRRQVTITLSDQWKETAINVTRRSGWKSNGMAEVSAQRRLVKGRRSQWQLWTEKRPPALRQSVIVASCQRHDQFWISLVFDARALVARLNAVSATHEQNAVLQQFQQRSFPQRFPCDNVLHPHCPSWQQC